jgi:hypothetical protein
MNYSVLNCDDDEDDSLYDFIAIIKNKAAYKDFIENIDDAERNYDKVTQIFFGDNFDIPIDNLPQQITHIKIGKSFTHHDSIPKSVKHIIIRKGKIKI